MDEKRENHESYGVLEISRFNGGSRHYFGSSIEHENGISMTVRSAELIRGGNHDFYLPRKTLLRIEMSPSQFTDAITTMNCDGVPITIRKFNGETMEDPPFFNKRLQFEENFKDDMRKISNKIDSLAKAAQNMLESKKPNTKKEKEAILDLISNIRMEFNSNIPYMATCFNEQMDKTVKEAKAEIDATVNSTITRLGLEKISDLKQLTEGGKDNEK